MKLTAKQQVWAGIIIGAVAIFGVVKGYLWLTDIKDEASYYAGAYDEAVKQRKAVDKAATIAINKAKGDIILRDARIKGLEMDLGALGVKSNTIGATLADLQEKYKALTDCPSQKANLLLQVQNWKDRFTLAQDELGSALSLVAEWRGKYNAQVVIAKSFEDQYKACDTESIIAKDRIDALESDLRRMRLVSKIRTGIELAAVVGVLYSIVKK